MIRPATEPARSVGADTDLSPTIRFAAGPKSWYSRAMTRSCLSGQVAAAALCVIYTAGHVSAGDGNTLILTQQGGDTVFSNTIFVDQTQATSSFVGGDVTNPLVPALQSGGGNDASITLSGFGATVALQQTAGGPAGSSEEVNSVVVAGGDLATVTVIQNGRGNDGRVDVGPGENLAELFQYGDYNSGTVTVAGTNNRGVLIQDGNGNDFSLSVTGSNTTVGFTQVGDGLTTAQPLQVYSNAGTVQITQYSF